MLEVLAVCPLCKLQTSLPNAKFTYGDSVLGKKKSLFIWSNSSIFYFITFRRLVIVRNAFPTYVFSFFFFLVE